MATSGKGAKTRRMAAARTGAGRKAPAKRTKPAKPAAPATTRAKQATAPAKARAARPVAKRPDAAVPVATQAAPVSGVERVGEAIVILGNAALAVTAAAVAGVLGAATGKPAETPAAGRETDEDRKPPRGA